MNKVKRRQFLRNTAIGGTAAVSLTAGLGEVGTAFAYSKGATPSWTSGSESLPTGHQYEISRGNTQVIVTEEGAGMRSLKVGGKEFLITYNADQPSTGYHGQVLLPWANRIAGGLYTFEGVQQQLPINEPANSSALHGVTHWMNWHVTRHTSDSITLEVVHHARDGYPFVVKFSETYSITKLGLEVFTTAQNLGSTNAPYGLGHHPYFTLGTPTINSNILRIPARSYFKTDNHLIIEPPAVTVEGTKYDFRTPRQLGGTVMDTNFADITYDSDGYARTYLSEPGGSSLTFFMSHVHKYMQIYTSDTQPTPLLRKAIVIEAYTGACNAFNNGLGLVVLKPGKSFTAHWGVTIHP
ncbi:MAG TPA: hypothetical protein VHZ51_05955 [Ktedonobacteraceae bacterium]|nr:hypothetical protein [Ktedonobacteraceae bacterium]